MTTGLIKYLVKSDRRDRGLGPRHTRSKSRDDSDEDWHERPD